MKEKIVIPDSYKYISAFLTMRCNLGCSYCLNNIEHSKCFNRSRFMEMTGEQWIEGLNRIESRPDVPVTLSGGEPFLHRDFMDIINNLKPELNIDVLTNLKWGKRGLDEFIERVNPQRLRRNASYASIRVSYHPEQMNAGELVESAKKLKDAGFSIGIWSVLYPSPEQLAAITQMQFRCRDAGLDFRVKDFTGEFKEELYGDYSKYPGSILQKETRDCLCKTTELLIGTNGKVYRCHRDVYAEESSIGNILGDFHIQDVFRQCAKYGSCHPCDVKVKTDYKQQLGHTSVEIKEFPAGNSSLSKLKSETRLNFEIKNIKK